MKRLKHIDMCCYVPNKNLQSPMLYTKIYIAYTYIYIHVHSLYVYNGTREMIF